MNLRLNLCRALLLLLGLSILPLAARADYQYVVNSTLTDTGIGPTEFSFTQPTLESSGFVTSGLTQISGVAAEAFSWNSVSSEPCPFVFGFAVGLAGSGCGAISFATAAGEGPVDAFDAGSFLAPGTYTGTNFSLPGTFTVTITQTGVPEPSSLLLLGTALTSLVGLRRKILN